MDLALKVYAWSNRLGQTKTNIKMSTEEKIFADGFSFKRNENAPDFVVGRLSLKVDEAIAFIKQHEKRGWINLNVKTARSGNHYIELDTYEPKNSGDSKPVAVAKGNANPKPSTKKTVAVSDDDDTLPF